MCRPSLPIYSVIGRNVSILCALTCAAAAAERPASDAELSGWVQKTVEERQPSAAERRFDEIGWLTDIRQALRLARENKRPVMLFTHDGHMAIGRC
jgi:hypothetical protein